MKNKRIYLLLPLFLMAAMAVFAQQKQKFNVVSFEEQPLDMTAREAGAKKDGTGSLYAIIKVTSTSSKDDLRAYNFDFDYLKHVVEVKDGELWVYVQRNAKHVTITREGYRTVRNYDLRTTIQAGKVYRMQLSPESESAKRQMVRFNVSPANAKAMIMFKNVTTGSEESVFGYVDDNGSVARSLDFGTYTYRVVSATHHTSEGRLVLNDRSKTHVENITLRPNYATVTFKTGEGIDIYINEEKKGTAEWTGVLKAGAHRVGSSKKGHSNVYVDVEITAGNDTVIQLPAPKPIYGSLAVVSTPLDAKIIIDGKECGLTPMNIDEILIGNHTVEISKDGYRTEIREVEIIEDETTDCNVQLTKGYNVKSTGTGSAKVPIVYNADGTRRSTRTRTVHGVVIDKNGYPVVGAKVMGTGGTESTEVAYDGTFSLQVPEWLKSITVKHEDFAAKKMKIHDGEMLVKMKKREWFLNFVGGYSFEKEEGHGYHTIESGAKIGLMFGTISNWGWYVKPLYCIESEGFSLAAGITKRFSQPLFLYAGIGFTTIKVTEGYDNEKSSIPKVDLGLLIRPTTHFNINFGCSGFLGEYNRPDGYEAYDAMHGIGISLNLGVGYVF